MPCIKAAWSNNSCCCWTETVFIEDVVGVIEAVVSPVLDTWVEIEGCCWRLKLIPPFEMLDAKWGDGITPLVPVVEVKPKLAKKLFVAAICCWDGREFNWADWEVGIMLLESKPGLICCLINWAIAICANAFEVEVGVLFVWFNPIRLFVWLPVEAAANAAACAWALVPVVKEPPPPELNGVEKLTCCWAPILGWVNGKQNAAKAAFVEVCGINCWELIVANELFNWLGNCESKCFCCCLDKSLANELDVRLTFDAL